MEKIGLIAGNGNFPYFFYEAANKKAEIFSIGLFETVNEKLKKVKNYTQINIGELGKLTKYLLQNDIKKIIMLGKVEKSLVFQELELDNILQVVVGQLPDRKDETLIFGIIAFLKSKGIEILPQNYLMDELLIEEKVYTKARPSEDDKRTIEIGKEAAKMLGQLDIGQTIVVNTQAVVALEGVEGTDETIKRSGIYAPKDSIIVKVSRPQQDMRVDVPAIGLKTIEEAIKINAKGLILEADKVIFLDKEAVIKKADENGLFLAGERI